MEKKNISISFDDFSSVNELCSADKDLCNEAVLAMKNSHSPYSEFRVGAAIKLKSGKIIHGSNQENVAFPSGLCAERVALFTVGAQFPDDPIESIAITAHTDKFSIDSPVSPCGACLQVMSDFEQRQESSIRILLYCIGKNILLAEGIINFLPFQFIEERLVN
ncbi:cytidine deaminase [Daejeonella oryzae]|uniref:cytidine deaminase n=1 Tax=Daejeonella oryzae TaxID=1122943 RepID=UPI0004044978|nr:cytidine deaminase [Daejeonella oryzae]